MIRIGSKLYVFYKGNITPSADDIFKECVKSYPKFKSYSIENYTGLDKTSGDGELYITRVNPYIACANLLKSIFLGAKYNGPHDYVELRYRYTHHKGAYGYSKAFRLFNAAIRWGRHNNKRNFRFSWAKDCNIYWNKDDSRYPKLIANFGIVHWSRF